MTSGRTLCGALFVLTGAAHFLAPRRYEAVMPPYLPAHRGMVLASGAAEVVGGLALLTPGLERPARWCLVALLAAVFPANVHMAVAPDRIEGLGSVPRWLLWLRLPLQAVLVAWVVRVTRAT